MHDYGFGVPQDHHKALEYYVKAADKGSTQAINNLGMVKYLLSSLICFLTFQFNKGLHTKMDLMSPRTLIKQLNITPKQHYLGINLQYKF